jgi:6-phosphogluconate dehydrogenase (decarboxylating)
MATSSSGVKSWLLDKYAKQVEVECRDGAVNNAAESMSSKGSGEWKVNIKYVKKLKENLLYKTYSFARKHYPNFNLKRQNVTRFPSSIVIP